MSLKLQSWISIEFFSFAPEEVKSYFVFKAKESTDVNNPDEDDKEDITDGIESKKPILTMKKI